MTLVLVVARPPRAEGVLASLGFGTVAASADAPPPASATAVADAAAAGAAVRTDVWRAVRDEMASLRGSGDAREDDAPGTAVTPARLETLAAAIEADADDPLVTWATSAEEASDAVAARIRDGAAGVAVVPVGLAMDDAEGTLRDPELLELHRRIEAIGREHPDVELQYIGPPFDHAPALEAAVAALRPAGSDEPALFGQVVERVFGGDLERFARFMAPLQAGVPAGTRLILRGSAVQGYSYKTREPFDAKGPGTSDLDIVLIGEEAMAQWAPEAFYLAGVNTQPLYDEAPDLATPQLERARRAAQEVAGRPVALQAMARWFLDLRSGLQGTPYVVLAG